MTTAEDTAGAAPDRTVFEGTVPVALSAVAFSTAGLFTRLIHVDAWTILFWRGLFGGGFILGCIVWTERRRTGAAFATMGAPGLVAAACSTIATICFVLALRHTTVAAVTIIYATAPLIAAGVAWLWLRDHPSRRTLLASLLALAGVMTLAGDGAPGGQTLGDVLALAMTCLMALMMVVVHRYRRVSMLPGACLSALACAVLVAPLARPFNVTISEFGLLALFGVSQFGLGLLLLILGSRRLPGPRASLLTNLELPLAPLWVWLAFGEAPTGLVCLGSAIVCAAVLLDAAESKEEVFSRKKEPKNFYDLCLSGRNQSSTSIKTLFASFATEKEGLPS